jgi:DNA-binding IclR family transcriptional regulator
MEERFVAQDGTTRRYLLGPESFAVGLAAEPNYALQRTAAPFLRSVALETGDWVFFTVRHGFEAICLSRENGDIPYPQAALRVGDRHPLGLGAGGLAILAALPEDEAEKILSINGPLYPQLYPSMTLPVVRRLLAETRAQGYALMPGLMVPDYWGIGVAVLRPDGQPTAAVILIASPDRLSGARQTVIAARLRRLSRDLMMTPSEE